MSLIAKHKVYFLFPRTVYTYALNNRGGVEAHFTVTTIDPSSDRVIGAKNIVRALKMTNIIE